MTGHAATVDASPARAAVDALSGVPSELWPTLVRRVNGPAAATLALAARHHAGDVAWTTVTWMLSQAPWGVHPADGLVEAIAPTLAAADSTDVLTAFAACPDIATVAACIAHVDPDIAFADVADAVGRHAALRVLPAFLSRFGLRADVWSWLCASRCLPDELPAAPLRIPDPDLILADVLADDAPLAVRVNARWLVTVAPAPVAARVLEVTPEASVSSERAIALLDAGADLESVVTAARRWSRPSWNGDPRIKRGAAAYGDPFALAMLELTPALTREAASRLDVAASLPLAHALVLNGSCRPATRADRALVLRALVLACAAAGETCLPAVPWLRAGDAAALRRLDEDCASHLDRMLRAMSRRPAPAAPLALLRERLPHLDLDWATVGNPQALTAAGAYLDRHLSGRERETARALLPHWCGTLVDLRRSAAAL